MKKLIAFLPLLLCFLCFKSVVSYGQEQTVSLPGLTGSTEKIVLQPVKTQTGDTIAAKRQAIRRFLELTHERENAVASMHGALKDMQSDADDSIQASLLNSFVGKIDSVANVIVDSAVPIYEKYYSLNDLNALNQLYGSPVMQYSMHVSSSIVGESQAMGEKIGHDILTNLISNYLAAHPEVLQEQPADSGRSGLTDLSRGI